MTVQRLVTPIFCLLIGANVASQEADTTLTADDLRYGAEIFGIPFTEVERDSMLDAVRKQLVSFRRLRQTGLLNSVPPAIKFDPTPVGWKNTVEQVPIRLSSYADVALPENRNGLAYLSVGELGALIRSGKLTSLDLTEFCLDRLRTHGPTLRCVITLTEELAREQAKQADREIAAGAYRGPLHGIPYGIKDLFATKEHRTTWGAEPYKEQRFEKDAAVVSRLREAGAVLVAKLTLGALAWGDVWYGGKTRNPWNIEKGSSGSSAGSAAAVSAGLVPFAIGTETWGSIVSPATRCGVTGLRPTFGRVSRAGAMALSWSMDKVGPICRTVEDCALVFDAIHGVDPGDPSTVDLPFNYDPVVDLSRLRIGYLKSRFETDYRFKETDARSLEKLRELGANLIPMDLPAIPVFDMAFILESEAAAAFDDLTRSGRDDELVRQIKNAWPNVFRASRYIPAVEYINANRLRYQLIQEMDRRMKEIDVYISPTSKGPNTLMTNLTGHPCVVLPNGFREGTPTSIVFVGRLYDEGTLLAVAKAYQDATDFHRKHPSLKQHNVVGADAPKR